MPEIGRLDGNCLLVAVISVPTNAWITDRSKKTVRLPKVHDMRDRIGQYYYDFDADCFMPKQDVSDVLDDVIDSLVHLVVELSRHTNINIAETHIRNINKWTELKNR